MYTLAAVAIGATVVAAQNNFPPPPVYLTATKSGVLPVLPTNFPAQGLLTNEGAIITKAPVNSTHTGVLGPAVEQTNEPAGTYSATLPAVAFDSLTGTTPSGSIVGTTTAGQTGVTFTISFSNLPDVAKYGPFVYHIHNQPVPADGNCSAAGSHLDTTNVGEYYTCDSTQPQNCQTGDLAGKHGKIMANSFSVKYTDNFLSTDPSSAYFFGAKSIVIHTSNTTRLTCANFVQGAVNGTSSSSNATSTGSSSTATASSTPAAYTGGASKALVGSAAVGLAALLAAFM